MELINNEGKSLFVFLDQGTTDLSLLNAIFLIQNDYELRDCIYIFSVNNQNPENFRLLREKYFLTPPFSAIYEGDKKILEFDLKNEWGFIEDVLRNHLFSEEKVLKKHNDLSQEFLNCLESIFLEKIINGKRIILKVILSFFRGRVLFFEI